MTPADIAKNTLQLRGSMPQGVELVAVSKFHPIEAIMAAYSVGQRAFGESRATELVTKAHSLPNDIFWHFIGHLQTNKVRMILPFVSMIHSVDSERLLRTIDAEAHRICRKIDILLQVHVAQEETKFGFTLDELITLVASGIFSEMTEACPVGVMGMASNTDDEARIAADFDEIHHAYDILACGAMAENPQFKVISMGMSHDYVIAIAHGSNMVRIGTGIFGEREY